MLINILLLCALGLMWGSSYALTKIAIADIAPIWTVAGRLIIATIILLVLARLWREEKPQGEYNSAHNSGHIWLWYLAMAIIGIVMPFFLISWGQQYADSALASVLVAFTPLMALVLAHFFTQDEKMTPLRLIGFLIGFAGICVLIGPRVLLLPALWGVHSLAELAIFCGALCFAANTLLARLAPDAPLMQKSAALNGIGAAIALPLGLTTPPLIAAALSYESLVALFALGLLPTALATPIWWALVKRAGVGWTSLGNYLTPLVAVFIGVSMMGEVLEPRIFIALALIISGIALSAVPARRRSQAAINI